MRDENTGTLGASAPLAYIKARPVAGKPSVSTATGSRVNRTFLASSKSGTMKIRFIPRRSDHASQHDATS